MIEVGVWKGLSSTHIARWLQRQNRGVLLSIDTWLGAPEFWTRRSMGNKARSLHLEHGWPTVYWTFLSNMVSAQKVAASCRVRWLRGIRARRGAALG